MKKIVFALSCNELLAKSISEKLSAETGQIEIRYFPDGETYVRVLSNVLGKDVIIVATLHNPDDKLLPLYFLSKLLKELKANKVTLVAPYLAYMRQDKRFKEGEAVTSEYFAKLLSSFTDEIITIDPHLHRRHSMSEIYTVPCKVIHASELISKWIKENVNQPLLIGPDSESEQWISEAAKNANAPFIILEKKRLGDNEVIISIPQVEKYKNHTPVLVDDIISTAHTMIETIGHLKEAGMKSSVCIGVHAVFAGNAFEELKKTSAKEIITCNTIPHESNGIDISDLLVSAI
ncbi:MAG: ribose-phosphate pyrophosphokinase [Bacteroidetes bacterium]|nr:MAG: ribose-phosphate pyrophosphokinase [Bacteroidota bacterium]